MRRVLIPSWPKNAEIGYKLNHARAEGIDAKRSFREAFKRGRRCLIAADGFYEWQKKGAAKQPWRITLADGEPFAFGGLWERWEKAADGVPVESCIIQHHGELTAAPAPSPLTSDPAVRRLRGMAGRGHGARRDRAPPAIEPINLLPGRRILEVGACAVLSPPAYRKDADSVRIELCRETWARRCAASRGGALSMSRP